MLYDTQLILSPSSDVLNMLKSRMPKRGRELLESQQTEGELHVGAVGLVQGKLVDMFAAADIAAKSAPVQVAELLGLCPQHFSMIGIFGDAEAVNTALQAIAERLSKPTIAEGRK